LHVLLFLAQRTLATAMELDSKYKRILAAAMELDSKYSVLSRCWLWYAS